MSVKVKLEVLGNGGSYIKAPDFCPYKEAIGFSDGQTIYQVPAALCPLCRRCDFTIEDTSLGITQNERDKCHAYFTHFNTKIANSISGQQLYLTKENRLPLIILVNINLLDQCLQYVCNNNKQRIEEIKNHLIFNETPICHVIGCPVVLSNKLTKSPIQVVGEVQWK